MAEWIGLGFGRQLYPPIVHCVVGKFQTKMGQFVSVTLSPTLDLEKISPRRRVDCVVCGAR